MPRSSYADDSGASTLAAINHKLTTGHQPNIRIHLDNHYNAKVYTSSSAISGHVSILTSKDTRFDSLYIILLGMSKTRIDGVHAPHTTAHTFLKLQMPIPESSYPVPRVYEAGRTYNIPFNFVIPSQLTISACSHKAESNAVHDHHLCLPPSLGFWTKGDFSPDMAKIEYAIKARVFVDHDLQGYRDKIMEASQRIQVLPAYMEEAPLNVTKKDKLYTMSKSKTIRKSLISAKLGTLSASAAQPLAAMLSSDGRSVSKASTIIDLTFDPSSGEVEPPKVTGVSAKVTAITYYAASGIMTFPHMGDWSRNYQTDGRGSYSSSTSLFSVPLDKVKWHRSITEQGRRDSGYSSDYSDSHETRRRSKSSKSKASPVNYTTSLRVPIELPTDKKQFLPSFNSCIASRAYVLSMTVTINAGGTNSTITLGVPMQIGVESLNASVDETGLPSFEAAVEEAEADAHLQPRTLHMPNVEFARHTLPIYGDLVMRPAVAS